MKSLRKSKTFWVIVVLAVALVGLVGTRAARMVSGRWNETVTEYSTAVATRGALEVAVGGTGTLLPRATQEAVATAGATVARVLVKPGDEVQAGQVLVVLENESLADQVAAARIQARLAEIDFRAAAEPGEADIAAARAAFESARLAAERAREDLDALVVRAPFTGRVTGLNLSPGDELPPGSPLFDISTPDNWKAVLSVPEDLVEELDLGDELKVEVPAVSHRFTGTVTSIDAQGQAGQRGATYQVIVDLEGTDPDARGGMSLTAAVRVSWWPGRSVDVPGVLAYDRFQTVTTPTGGIVISVEAAEGETVEEGDVVLTLESAETEAALAQAEADLARAQENLERLLATGEDGVSIDEQVEKLRLRYEETLLRLSGLERQLGDLTVRADFDGVVTDVFVTEGGTVGIGDTSGAGRVVSVADLSEVTALVSIDELEVAGIRAGMAATVRIDALPAEVFQGVVESVSLKGQTRDGVTNYQARITLAGNPRMRAGMSLSATIEVARRENALLVPLEAVYGAGQEAQVMILVEGQPVARDVVVGLSSDTMAEILEGLQEGETVVTGSLEVDFGPFGGQGYSGPHGGGG